MDSISMIFFAEIVHCSGTTEVTCTTQMASKTAKYNPMYPSASTYIHIGNVKYPAANITDSMYLQYPSTIHRRKSVFTF